MKIYKTITAVILLCLICVMPAFAVPTDGEELREQMIAATREEHRLLPYSDTAKLRETEEDWVADPDGSVLTASGGVNYYFDQKETYYNLNMDTVVAIAHDQGIEGEYWVRDDGCKMLGDYIMIAANREVHPQGSIVPTSLGLGVVVDTGEFAFSDPTQVDIAVTW